jgi:hypothetical protein
MAGGKGLKRPALTPLQQPRNRIMQQCYDTATTDATSPSSSIQTPLVAVTPANTREYAQFFVHPDHAILPASNSVLLLKHAEINQLHKVLTVRELTALSV